MYKFLDFKIYAHEFYRLKSDTFESDRGGVGTCIGTTGINGDHPAQTESVVTVPRLDFQVPWSQQCCLNSGLHATQFSGWLVGRLLCTWHLSKTAEHFVFFFFFFKCVSWHHLFSKLSFSLWLFLFPLRFNFFYPPNKYWYSSYSLYSFKWMFPVPLGSNYHQCTDNPHIPPG